MRLLFALVVLLSVVLPTLSLERAKSRQATRQDVVTRMRHREASPLQPRTSAQPCLIPSDTPSTIVVTDSSWTYDQYYAGSGETEDINNPGNDFPGQFPPVTNDLGYLTAQEAVEMCADYTAAANGDQYWSFDLHFTTSTCTWICVSFFDANNDPSYFDKPDSSVPIGYGYYIVS